jgi:HSP20 family molecular chaperone IbpA
MQPQAQQPMQPQPQQHMQPQAQQPMQLQSQQHMQPQPQQPMQPQPQNVQNVQQEPLIHANANFFSAAQTNQHFKPGQVLSYSLSETNKSYLVESELPGQQIHALDISVRDQVLLINGERQPEQSTNQVQYLSNERYFGHFQRAIQIPGQIDVSKVTAKIAAGMLIIELPKHANNNENFRNIQVNLG